MRHSDENPEMKKQCLQTAKVQVSVPGMGEGLNGGGGEPEMQKSQPLSSSTSIKSTCSPHLLRLVWGANKGSLLRSFYKLLSVTRE